MSLFRSRFVEKERKKYLGLSKRRTRYMYNGSTYSFILLSQQIEDHAPRLSLLQSRSCPAQTHTATKCPCQLCFRGETSGIRPLPYQMTEIFWTNIRFKHVG
jgi:hypothetical protein